jgi:hypothetical protein
LLMPWPREQRRPKSRKGGRSEVEATAGPCLCCQGSGDAAADPAAAAVQLPGRRHLAPAQATWLRREHRGTPRPPRRMWDTPPRIPWPGGRRLLPVGPACCRGIRARPPHREEDAEEEKPRPWLVAGSPPTATHRARAQCRERRRGCGDRGSRRRRSRVRGDDDTANPAPGPRGRVPPCRRPGGRGVAAIDDATVRLRGGATDEVAETAACPRMASRGSPLRCLLTSAFVAARSVFPPPGTC